MLLFAVTTTGHRTLRQRLGAPSLRLERENGYAPEYLGSLDSTLTSAVDRLSLELAIARLPAGFRTVLVLHDVEGYKHSEIARMRSLAEGTWKSQLHKARARLRDLLEPGGADAFEPLHAVEG